MNNTLSFPSSSSASPPPSPLSHSQNRHRDSNVLRASVLDAALLLGVGSSRTLQDWIFNTVDESDEVGEIDDEDAEVPVTPECPSIEIWESVYHEDFDATTLSSTVLNKITNPMVRFAPSHQRDTRRLKKTRKSRVGHAGDDDDVGYISEGGAIARRKASKARRPAMLATPSYDNDAGYLSESTPKKKGLSFLRLITARPKDAELVISAPRPLSTVRTPTRISTFDGYRPAPPPPPSPSTPRGSRVSSEQSSMDTPEPLTPTSYVFVRPYPSK